MINCKELNRSFDTDQEMFKALRDGHKEIVSIKKAQILKSIDKGASVKSKTLKYIDSEKGLVNDDNFFYIVTNTTNILDSHKDLHVNGIWDKSAKERNRKNYLVDTHELSIKSTIARKEYVEIMVVDIPFSSIGKDYQGSTQALVYKIPKDKILDRKTKEWLESGDDIESSVRMQYVQVFLAMNSEDPEDEVFKSRYDEYVGEIANKEDFENEFEEVKYFWVVKEAKNINESSLVLFGSNGATGSLKNKKKPSKDTSKKQPSKDTASIANYYKHLN